jgi:hypothetical protein
MESALCSIFDGIVILVLMVLLFQLAFFSRHSVSTYRPKKSEGVMHPHPSLGPWLLPG